MNKKIPIILGILLLSIAIWAQITSVQPIQSLINRLENLAYDIQLRANLLTHHQKTFNSSVVIVDVDDRSFIQQGRWPWPRSKLAILVDHLRLAGAVVIVFDSIFMRNENNITDQLVQAANAQQLLTPTIQSFLQKIRPSLDNDQKFADSLAQVDAVLGISFSNMPNLSGALPKPLFELQTPQEKLLGFIVEPGILANTPLLQSAAKNSGFINAFADEDGIIRRVPLLIRYKDSVYPSLALEAVRLYLLAKVKLVTAQYSDTPKLEGIIINNYFIPTDEQAQVVIPFRGKRGTFHSISATDVITNHFPASEIEGKIVFVGATAIALGDLKPTAVESFFPGVEIQATIADGIIKHQFSYSPAWATGAEISFTLILGILLAVIFPYLGPRLLSLLIILVPLTLFFVNDLIWTETGLIISFLIPLCFSVTLALMNIIYGYLFETLRREHLKSIFQQYVPIKHIDQMLKNPSKNFGLHGEERDMTVLFADIRNFTKISEKLTADQVKELLDKYLTPMTEVIFKNHGTIDKYIGDSIMAFWGAPLKDKRHAQHAVAAALEMQQTLQRIQPEFAARKWPEIRAGIGVNSGIMSVGDMGSKFRRNYTVLGDEVNLAARVEMLTKHYGVKIIVTEHTKVNSPLFLFRKIDKICVVGKEHSIEIYEPICKLSAVTPEIEQDLQLFNLALEHYFASRWDEARAILTSLQQDHPEDKLPGLFLHRIELFKQNPPDENWDGTYTFVSK